jgi:hypothetical protein
MLLSCLTLAALAGSPAAGLGQEPPGSPAAGPAQAEGVRHSLFLFSEAGWVEFPGALCADGAALPLPLLARSERVPRARLESRGVRLRLPAGLSAASIEARSLLHEPAQRVTRLDGELVLIGPPELPWRLQRLDSASEPSGLAELSRLDGQALAGRLRLEIALRTDGAPRRLLGWPRSGGPLEWRWSAGADERHGNADLALPPQDALELPSVAGVQELWLGASGLDQLGLFEVQALDFAACAPVSARPGPGPAELWLQVPRPPEGRTATLLLSVRDLAPAAAIEASAEAASQPEPSWFDERSAELGLAHGHLEGPDEQLDIRPTMGPGAAFGDLEQDGWFDLYAVQGGGRAGSAPEAGRFFHNRGDRGPGFEERSHDIGARSSGAGMGALWFEADGDGFPDLFVAQYGDNVLLHNRPGGALGRRLEDRSAALDPHPGWNAGVCAGDVDLDGDLDLYTTTYLVYDEALMPAPGSLALKRDDPPAMLPYAFPGGSNALFINRGDWASAGPGARCFVDEAEARGVADRQGRGMQPILTDYDGDGDLDLYVANDVSPNSLFENDGAGRFTNVAFDSGVDDPRGGMGLALGDVDLDGDLDWFLSNWELDANGLYLNNVLNSLSQKHRTASFTDVAVKAGLAAPSVGRTGWGAELFDAEGDGDLDLLLLNGYTSPDYESTGICMGQPAHFFLNDGAARFEAAFGRLGAFGAELRPWRCLAGADFDRDGDLDFLATSNNGPARFLVRNAVGRVPGARWLALRLAGRPGNPDAIGALVQIEAEGLTLVQEQRAGTSYLAGNPPELLFQLPPGPDEVSISVRWPFGGSSSLSVRDFDRRLTVEAPR